jgi:endopeptidase La
MNNMNTDIDKWINHINGNKINTKSTKRKRDDNDEKNEMIINELVYTSVENLINLIKNFNNKSYNTDEQLDNYILGLKATLKNSLKLLSEKKLLSGDLSKSDNINMCLLLRASISIKIDTINLLIEEKKACNLNSKVNRFNVLRWLNNYKKAHETSDKKIKYIDIKLINNPILQDDSSNETTDDEYDPLDEMDETDDSCDSLDDDDWLNEANEDDVYSPCITKFINQLKHISNSNGNSKEEIVNYFNTMNKSTQKNTMSLLNDLSNVNTKTIPSLFKILLSPLNEGTKINLINKILNISNGMTENGKMKKWLDDVMKIQFGVYKGIDINNTLMNSPNKTKTFLNNMKDTMNKAVWGHNDAKKNIIQIIAQTIRNPLCEGSVIGLWGPPGNGKTTLIKHGIAKAMNKPFIFISLGGATDSSFLEGHSFTYEGSIYGRIAQAIIDAKCMNPIIYFDELDKVSETPKGEEIINLLVHLIDPVQNQSFRDKYFYDVDIDLSKVTFIFSFNDPSLINYILMDRITLIETKHLTLDQKLHIAKNYLMKDILKEIGMKENSIIIPDNIIEKIINDYTNEGGVRSLKKKLYSIVRELNVGNLTNNMIANTIIKFPLTYTMSLFNNHYHGKSPFNPMVVHKHNGIGMVNGLWANSMGVGGILPIESVLIPTNEIMSVKATGSLGNVIKESIEVAMSVAWNWLNEDIKQKWIKKWKTKPERFHIHCPDGSSEKEGPSAGAALSLAFFSRLTNRMIRHNVAMTGEINLRGDVTEIGGLEEKLCAAKRGGATLVLVPYENNMNLIEIKKRYPLLIDSNFNIICVKTFDQVIEHCLMDENVTHTIKHNFSK